MTVVRGWDVIEPKRTAAFQARADGYRAAAGTRRKTHFRIADAEHGQHALNSK